MQEAQLTPAAGDTLRAFLGQPIAVQLRVPLHLCVGEQPLSAAPRASCPALHLSCQRVTAPPPLPRTGLLKRRLSSCGPTFLCSYRTRSFRKRQIAAAHLTRALQQSAALPLPPPRRHLPLPGTWNGTHTCLCTRDERRTAFVLPACWFRCRRAGSLRQPGCYSRAGR